MCPHSWAARQLLIADWPWPARVAAGPDAVPCGRRPHAGRRCDAQDDRRRGHGPGSARAGRRHPVRPAGRAERRAVQRAVRGGGAPAGDRHPARAGRRLHGVRLRRGERAAGRLLRRARPRLSQHHRGARHRVRVQCPGPVPVRPGAAAPHRPRLRPAARAARPARHHAAPDQVGRAHRGAARRAAPDRRGVRADADRPAAPGRARDPDGRAGGGSVARGRDAARPRGRQPRARSRRARAGGRPAERRGAADDLRRRRRPGRQRAGARPRRAARRAGGRRLDGPGRDGRPLAPVAQPDHGAPPVARGRRRARDRLALPARADRLGAGRRGQGDPHRPRPDRDHPPRAPRGGAARGRRRGAGRAARRRSAPSTDRPGAGASPR